MKYSLDELIADQENRARADRMRLVEVYLAEIPELEDDADAVVELLLREYRLRHELGEHPAAEEYLRRFPQFSDRLKRQFTLQKLLSDETTNQFEFDDPNETAPFITQPISNVKDRSAPMISGYQILGELGRGGMGVVYKARQLSLRRIAALKVLSDRDRATKDQLARFRREAESLARLKHPNIVQVYEIAECDGVAYFAMEFVEGGDLDACTKQAAQSVDRTAELMETLARAIHAAHSHSLVHRDLKPSNILMTPEGEPKITDFGLVKRLEQDETQTHTGLIFGTPAYMAPEQSTGDPRAVGAPADVYALGGIAYTLLTGRAPFVGASVVDTLDKVRNVDPIPPRKLRPDIPRDIETICLKCLEKNPSRRYASALELADDLRRFRGQQPISARPVGHVERLNKWIRRRPALAACFIISAIAVLSFLTVSVWAHFRVRAEARRAEEKFQLARSVVDDLYTKVAVEWLADEPGQDPLRKQLLEKSLKLYLKFAAEKSQDEDIRKNVAQSYFRVAQIYRMLGRFDEAKSAYARAIDLQEKLCADFPADTGIQHELAESYNWLGELYRQQGDRIVDAEKNFNHARKVQTQLVRRQPTNAAYRKSLARSHYNIAIVLNSKNQGDEAERHFGESIRLLTELREEFADGRKFIHELARSHINRGVFYKQKSKFDSAKADYDHAVSLLQINNGKRPKASWRYDLGVSHYNVGVLYLRQRNYRKSLEELDKSLRIFEVLDDDFPTRPQFKKQLALVYNSLGSVYWHQAKTELAHGHWKRAETVLVDLMKRIPNIAEHEQQFGIVLGNLALASFVKKDLKKSRQYLDSAIQHLSKAHTHNPKNPEIRRYLRNQYQTLAEVLLQLGEHRAAVKAALSLAEVFPDRPLDAYFAACFIARCVPLVEKDSAIKDAGIRDNLAAQNVRLALKQLKRATQLAGEIQRLPNEREIFKALSNETEYRAILAQLNKRAVHSSSLKE